jgi:peptide/nickel transport system substrate-binding protein
MSCAVFRAAPVREFLWGAGETATRMIARVAGVAVAIALLASQPAPAADVPKRGGILEFASTVEPGNYDCHGNTSFAFLHPVAPHYSTLLKFDAANYPQIVGDLAQSWEVSADRQTYTFKLRPNVLFHDGSRLTSADIKASYQRLSIHRRASPHRGRSISALSRRSTRPTR